MKMLAWLLAVIFLIVAIVYFVIPAGSLPGFMPGFEAGSAHVHMKHAAIALVVAIIFGGLGWFAGRR
jgi:hypothetical protein